MKDLESILSLIHSESGKVFVPISISHSPVKPATQFIIVLRASENVQSYTLQGWFTSDIPKLCQKFVTKTIKIDASYTPQNYHTKLN